MSVGNDKPVTRAALLGALGRVEDRANETCLYSDYESREYVIAQALSELCQQLAAELVNPEADL